MQINIKEMSNEALGNPYIATSYQYTGVYYDPALDIMYFVNKPNNLVNGVYNAKRFLNGLDFGENTVGILSSNLQNTGISEATMLKMIAIVQIAKDLV